MKFSKKSPGRLKNLLFLFLLLSVVLGGGGFYLVFFEGEQPSLNIAGLGPYLGQDTKIKVIASDTESGLRKIEAWVIQGETVASVYSQEFPRGGYRGQIGPPEHSFELPINAKAAGLKEGEVTVRVEAVDYSMRGWLKGNKVILEKSLVLDSTPPKIQTIHTEKYIDQGGTGIAIYRVDDMEASHGVQINNDFHPGFPIGDGRNDTNIAYFAVPFDAQRIDTLELVATDKAGNLTKVPFSTNLKNIVWKSDSIGIGDGFLNAKMPEFTQHYPELQDKTPVDGYLQVNNQVRQENNAKISEIARQTSSKRLWKDAFHRMPGSPKAGYADHRTYLYGGKEIDRQVHLGVDIASTARAEVRSANTGVVIYADYLGIYGNMVIVDHGQGVASLYSHLSQINARAGDEVTPASVLGLSGTSGMAGGDHLHFSMLVNGVFVTPKEWWDQNWIEVTINEPLVDSKF